jgi:hypothetical protein
MKKANVEELRPTQMTHGEREVSKKADEYRGLEGHDLDMAIAEKPIPIVGACWQTIRNRPPPRRSRTRTRGCSRFACGAGGGPVSQPSQWRSGTLCRQVRQI